MLNNQSVRLVQALTGAVVLTLLMMPMSIFGFGQYIWMLFLPLLLFFAFKAQFKLIPSMIVCYACGVVWAYISGILQNLFASFAPEMVVNTVPTIICIFLILTVHENWLSKTIFGNVPSLFLGMSTTFFVFMIGVDITGIHLIAFFIYGIILSVLLVLAGTGVCTLIFGKKRVQETFAPPEAALSPDSTEVQS